MNEYLETLTGHKPIFLKPCTTYTLTLSSTTDWVIQPGNNGTYAQLAASLSVSWNEYLSHDVDKTAEAGGLRVSKIVDNPLSAAQSVITTSYKYVVPGNDTISSGYSLGLPANSYFSYTYPIMSSGGGPPNPTYPWTAYFGPCRYVVRTSSSPGSLFSVKGSGVGYEFVTVFRDSSGTAGKTVSRFSKHDDVTRASTGLPLVMDGVVDNWPQNLAKSTGYDWLRGLLLEETKFRYLGGRYIKTNKLINNYKYFDALSGNQKSVLGLKVVIKKGELTGPAGESYRGYMVLLPYHFISSWSHLSSKKEYRFDSADTTKFLNTSEYFYYSDATHAQLTTSKSVGSAGDTVMTNYSYPLSYSVVAPADASSVAIKAMQSSHMLSNVVEKQVWIKPNTTLSTPRLIAAELNTFRQLPSSSVLPDATFALKVNSPLAINNTAVASAGTFMPSQTTSNNNFIYDDKFKEIVRYESYDSYGNVLQYRKLNGVPTASIWGYDHKYIICEIINGTYGDAVAILGQATLDELSGSNPGTDQQVKLKLAPLRADSRLKKALITTITYNPLVGVTSQTDPSGRSTSYEYDELGRLVRARDEQGRILAQQQYHYGRP